MPLKNKERQNGVVILIGDSDFTESPTEGVLRTLFGLTPAEEKVAIGLGRGKTLNEIAAELSISKETARKHLAQIFAKTGVNRQSQLVKILASRIITGTP